MQHLHIALEYTASNAFDIDLTAFMLANDKYIPTEGFMVYYHNLASTDGSVKYVIENKNKYLEIDLSKTASEIEEIYIIVSIYEAATKNQCFSKIPTIEVSIIDIETGQKLNSYALNTAFPNETSVELGRLFVRYGKWRWETLSVGYKESLDKFVNKYVY